MAKRLNGKVNVEVWPVQMVGRWPLDMSDGTYRRVVEPGKLGEGYKQLLVGKQDPEAVRRNICDLSCQSALPTLRGFHLRAP